MTRVLYATLLRLHPPAFRRQFASELLWIFDEARLSGRDCDLASRSPPFQSPGKWLVRSGLYGK